MAEKNETFEEVLRRLEEIVESMDNGGLSLEESMKLYEEGIVKADKLEAMLAEARDKVLKLVSDKNGAVSLEPFEGKDAP